MTSTYKPLIYQLIPQPLSTPQKNRIGGIDVKMPKVTLPDFQIHGFMISILSEAKGQH